MEHKMCSLNIKNIFNLIDEIYFTSQLASTAVRDKCYRPKNGTFCH